jgi:YggT family protein
LSARENDVVRQPIKSTASYPYSPHAPGLEECEFWFYINRKLLSYGENEVIAFLINLIDIISRLLLLLILVQVVLSYFMSPFHPVRLWIDRIVGPMLNPIRSRLPLVGMLDFSPIVLMIVIQVIAYLLKLILLNFL